MMFNFLYVSLKIHSRRCLWTCPRLCPYHTHGLPFLPICRRAVSWLTWYQQRSNKTRFTRSTCWVFLQHNVCCKALHTQK